jgi:hypothetical protein
VCTLLPLTIAFNLKSRVWSTIYVTSDVFFLFDIISIFFTSIAETEDLDEIIDSKTIAITYLRGWFFVDVLAILPIEQIIMFFENEKPNSSSVNFNVLFRAPRM